MKKLILALAILLTAALVFTGCGGNDAGGNPASSGLDGDWICTLNMGDFLGMMGMEQEEIDAFITLYPELESISMPMAKVTIKGNAAEMFTNEPDIEDWQSNGYQGEAPTNWVSEGTYSYTLEGSKITVTVDEDYSIVLTMAADKKSFSMEEDGLTMVFKKQ